MPAPDGPARCYYCGQPTPERAASDTPPPGYRAVVLTEEEARWAITRRQGAHAYRRRARAELRAARQVARCHHLYDSATGRCRFCVGPPRKGRPIIAPTLSPVPAVHQVGNGVQVAGSFRPRPGPDHARRGLFSWRPSPPGTARCGPPDGGGVASAASPSPSGRRPPPTKRASSEVTVGGSLVYLLRALGSLGGSAPSVRARRTSNAGHAGQNGQVLSGYALRTPTRRLASDHPYTAGPLGTGGPYPNPDQVIARGARSGSAPRAARRAAPSPPGRSCLRPPWTAE